MPRSHLLLPILAAALVGVGLTFGTKLFYQGLIANQEDRNETLRAEIDALDRQLADAQGFEARQARLRERMAIVEGLQALRFEAVYIMDGLANVIPDGVYLTSLTQGANNISVEGRALSNRSLARMLRNVNERAGWLLGSDLRLVPAPALASRPETQFSVSLHPAE